MTNPQVKVFDGPSGNEVESFFAADPADNSGVLPIPIAGDEADVLGLTRLFADSLSTGLGPVPFLLATNGRRVS